MSSQNAQYWNFRSNYLNVILPNNGTSAARQPVMEFGFRNGGMRSSDAPQWNRNFAHGGGIVKKTRQPTSNSNQQNNFRNHQKQQLRTLKDRLGPQSLPQVLNRSVTGFRPPILGQSYQQQQQFIRLDDFAKGSQYDPVVLSDHEDQSSQSTSSSLDLANPQNAFCNKLSRQIYKFYQRNIQTIDVLQQKRSLCNRLFDVARAAAETQYSCNMFLVGSTLNGCASKTSDADLCLYLPNMHLDKKKTILLLEKLRNRLRRTGEYGGIQLIRATVPIIKFHDKITGFECDLNINNSVGIRNTHLLKAYSLVDDRLSHLMFAIKYWARFNGINDASNGTFNSYSLALMTIFFLQVGVSPPIAPVLQRTERDIFSLDVEVEKLPRLDHIPSKYMSDNTQTVGELFCQFFKFYTLKFNFNTDIASIASGNIVKRATKSDPQWTDKYICIEEPFDRSNTARAVYSREKFEQIKRTIEMTLNRIERKREFDCFVSTSNCH